MGNAVEERAKAATLHDGDVIRILLEQHARIRDLFGQVQASVGRETKQEAFDELRALLAVHETAEELVLRPVTARLVGQNVVDERNDEEAEATQVLSKLESLDIDSPEFLTQFAEFEQAVGQHADAEERDEFFHILTACSEEERLQMGGKVRAAEVVAPTRPHPGVEPGSTTQKVTGPFLALLDRARDAISHAG